MSAQLEKDIKFSCDLALKINDLFNSGNFKEVDCMVEKLDFSKLNSTEVIGWCRFTCRAKERLKKYRYLINESRFRLKMLGKNIDSLMRGLI